MSVFYLFVIVKLLQEHSVGNIAGSIELSSWTEGEGANLHSLGGAGAIELLCYKFIQENSQPLVNCLLVIVAVKCYFCIFIFCVFILFLL